MNQESLPCDIKATTYKEAMLDIDFEQWLDAMKSKMDAIDVNQVWSLGDPPKGKKPIWFKQVFKRKTNVDDNMQKYKARLMAKIIIKLKALAMKKPFCQLPW